MLTLWCARWRGVQCGRINHGAGGEPDRCDRDERGPSEDRSLEEYCQTTPQNSQPLPMPEHELEKDASPNGQPMSNGVIVIPVSECDKEVLVTSL